jgi:hypothetical protein
MSRVPSHHSFFFRDDQPAQIRSLLLVTAVECRRRLLQNFVSTSVFKKMVSAYAASSPGESPGSDIEWKFFKVF